MTPSEQLPPTDQTLTEPQPDVVKDPSIAAGHSRRAFLFKLALAVNGVVGVVLAIPLVGYLLGPALRKTSAENSWINLGPLSDFPEGETRLVNYRNPITNEWDGQTADIPCWVRRVSGSTFQVFAINCAHLGCPVRWFAQSKLFLCPCHGGAYYADGSRASGPPERGLFEYDHKVSNGTLMISAGRMPTLANEAKNITPLTQIEGSPGARLNAVDQPQPRCSSCQT
jgi:menaquinol-cytochrome c reductase iron-sulfur subunit